MNLQKKDLEKKEADYVKENALVERDKKDLEKFEKEIAKAREKNKLQKKL
ncbi:hypothetical protein HMPREF1234_1514 [Streptococcus pyogenes GA41039]|nr:hypothetical protein HMPREF1234_1514 [Streptococcus pyogenes GA41039]